MKFEIAKKYYILSSLIILLCACDRPNLPMLATTEHNQLHGIINDGKTTNQIILFNEQNNNHPKLHFPHEISVSAETKGWNDITNPTPIRRGWASDVSIGMEMTKNLRLVPIETVTPINALGRIAIKFAASSDKNPKWEKEQRDYISKIITKSPISNIRQDWGLHEYMITREDYVSSYEYIPLDHNFSNSTEVPFRISCSGNSPIKEKKHTLSRCAAFFHHVDGIIITYTMSPTLLPYWRQVYTAINQFTTTSVQK